MSSNINNIDKHRYNKTDTFFFDTNIWLYLHCPYVVANQKDVNRYSFALKCILTTKCKIHIDVLILSEFINRYARLRKNISSEWKRKYFRKYCRSKSFKEVAEEIADACKRILEYCTTVDSCLEHIGSQALMDQYSLGDSDFNDLIIDNICKSKKYILVTHDSDFKNTNVAILTTNKRLLSN